jgi:diguanylate cyclase
VRTESLTDPLAALANRKFFNVELGKAIAEAKQCGEPQTLLMCDVDHFKALKRQIRAGDRDQVLRLVAMSMKQNVKGQDIAARYGGEDFIVALPKASLPRRSPLPTTFGVSKELMKRSSGERLGRVTISIGVAVLRAADTPADRARRRIPLCRQAQRPQSHHLGQRSRSPRLN